VKHQKIKLMKKKNMKERDKANGKEFDGITK
jgi:hypothetical protein